MAAKYKITQEVIGSDEITHELQMECEMCAKDGTNVPASAFCETCMDYFCKTCAKYHKIYLSTHELSEDDSVLTDVCLEKCSIHRNSYIKFFCESCGTIGCSVCRTETHKCYEETSIKSITSYVKKFEISKEVANLTQTVESVLMKLANTRRNIEKEEELGAVAVGAVQKAKEGICSKFDDLEKEMLSKINDKKAYEHRNLKEIDELESDVNELSLEISEERKRKDNQKCKLFIFVNRAAKTLEIINSKLQNLQRCNQHIMNYTFQADPKLKQLQLAIGSLQELGTLQNETTTPPQHKQEIENRYTAAHCRDIFGREMQEKEECIICSMCLLSVKYLVLCDLHNSSVKLVDLEENNVVFRRYVASPPLAVTKTDHNRVAIVQSSKDDANIGKIQFLLKTYKNELVFQRKFLNTEWPCTSLLYHDKKLYISILLDEKAKIQVIDMNGRVLKTFKTEINGDELSIWPSCLAYDTHRRILYVSDAYFYKIFKLEDDEDSGVAGYCTDISNLYYNCSPYGIVCNRDGLIFVCDKGSASIRVIDPNNTSNGYYLLRKEDGLIRPLAVAYCKKTNKLYVSSKFGDNIGVFSITEKPHIKQVKLQWSEEWVIK